MCLLAILETRILGSADFRMAQVDRRDPSMRVSASLPIAMHFYYAMIDTICKIMEPKS